MAWDFRQRHFFEADPGADVLLPHFPHLLSTDVFLQTSGAEQIVKWLQSADPAVVPDALDLMIRKGAIKKFAELYQSSTTSLETYAGVIFGFLACGDTRHATIAFNSGILPTCIARLSSPTFTESTTPPHVQAAWILGNLAADETECAETLLEKGVLNIMVDQIETMMRAQEMGTHASYACTLLWAVNHFLKSGSSISPDMIHRLTTLLSTLIHSEPDEEVILEECCFGLATISQMDPIDMSLLTNPSSTLPATDPFTDPKFFQRIVRLLQRGSNQELQRAALQLVGALTARSEDHTAFLLQFDLLSILNELIETKLGEDSCWVIANIVAGRQDQLDMVVSHEKILPTVVRLLKVDAAGFDEDEFAGRTRQCCSILGNIINRGQLESMRHVTELGGISALCCALRYCVETDTLVVVLDALWKAVRFGEDDKVLFTHGPWAQRDEEGEEDGVNGETEGRLVNVYLELFKEAGGLEGLERLEEKQEVGEAARMMLQLIDDLENPQPAMDEDEDPLADEDRISSDPFPAKKQLRALADPLEASLDM